MKITVEENKNIEETEILIKCFEVDSEIKRIISSIETAGKVFVGELDGEAFLVSVSDILYFETVDRNLFFYTNENVYKCSSRLYLLERTLTENFFARVSKTTVVNLRKLRSIKNAGNAKLVGILSNGEKIIVSRWYVPEIRKKLGV